MWSQFWKTKQNKKKRAIFATCVFYCHQNNVVNIWTNYKKMPLNKVGPISKQEKLSDIDSNELFDLILNQTGGFGRYQIGLLFLSLLASFTAACNHLSPIYLAFAPKHTCIEGTIAETPDSQLSLNDDQCWFGNKSSKIGCTKWSYDKNVFSSTIVSQWDLVCDNVPLLPTVASSYMAGVVLFNILTGLVSDRFGRRTVILALTTLHITASFATAFASSYLMFVTVRFFVGGSIHGVWSAYFVLMAESVPESARPICGGVLNFGWNLGSLLMTLMAYFIRDWPHLQLAFAILSLTLILFFFLVPESPRWLLGQGHSQRAEDVLQLIANKNGVDLSSTQFKSYYSTLKAKVDIDTWNNSTNQSGFKAKWNTFKHVATNREYVKRLFLLIPPWIAVGIGSYGIHFSVKLVDYDIFTVSAVKEVVIFVIILILMPIFKRVRRTWCLLICYILAGLAGLSFLLIQESKQAVKVVIFVLTQGLIVGNFYLVDTYSPDVFSTDIRNFTFSFLDSISKIGTTLAPFVVELGSGSGGAGTPPAIFGSLMLFSAFFFLLLPETRGLSLVQKVDELGQCRGHTIYDTTKRKIRGNETAV